MSRSISRIARVASKRYALPQLQKHHESSPRDVAVHDPTRRFEPFPYIVNEENKLDVLKRVITPLHDIPYEEQLAAKESYCRNALRSIAQDLYRSGTQIRLDVRRLPCQVNKSVGSPQIHNYRNSDELSLWYGHDGKTITAGYNVFPISKHGDTITVEPNGLTVLRDEVVRLSDILQQFIRTQAKLGVCFSLGDQGGWRSFKISSNLQGDLMLIGILNPRTLKVREVIDDRDNFRDFIVKRCKEEGLNLVSLYYQPCPHNHCKHEDVPYELLYGEKRLIETIGRYRFLISPESFVHQSSIGAEVLFETVRKTLKDCFITSESDGNQQKPLILDAQSGYGLLSISLADMAKHVIGVDDRAMGIEDARASAEMNSVKNCDFINSNLEIVLERIIDKYCSKNRNQELLVVCDLSPRGLHKNVIDVIRQCGLIKKILLVSSKITAARSQQAIINLCSKGRGRSLAPFAPILATPVDVCPHTDSFYTVLALERIPQ